jgi:hypothetical protein
MPNYVVLHHTAIENPHYDLMLDLAEGAELSTWRVAHWPAEPGDQFTLLSDHRRAYLEYEGPISGNRGNVNRVAAGEFQIIRKDTNAIVALFDASLRLTLPTIATPPHTGV